MILATSTWQQVTDVGTDTNFYLQNQSRIHDLLVFFGDTAADADAQVVPPLGTVIRAAVNGAVWVRSALGADIPVAVNVSA